MTRYEYEKAIEELLDQALNELHPNAFKLLLSNILDMVDNMEDSED